VATIDSPPVVGLCIREVARHHGDRSAVAYLAANGWCRWNYDQLMARADRVAACLQQDGAGPGDAIGIITARHPDTLAALIAILGLGAHYVPLDPHYPSARLELLCHDAGVKRIFSAVDPDTPLPAKLLRLAEDPTGPLPVPHDAVQPTPETPAYVMFTSGSTGQPKGVVVPHRAIMRLVDAPDFMSLDADTTFLWLAPLGFDASTLEIWGPLLNGGCCVVYPETQLPTAASIRDVVAATRVNAMWLTASLFNSLIDCDPHCLSGVATVLTGGEALSVAHVTKALAALPGTQLINGYGPTENTTFTTCYRIPRDFPSDAPRVPIGSPIRGSEVVIVDDALRPLPKDAEGELIALGDGLALGYLNRPGLTTERFITVDRGDGRMEPGYRTGDRVMRRADGLIDYLGRDDDQIKIDGHRIEPGEIEREIALISGVRDCRVLVVKGPQGQKRLAAYVVADATTRGLNLRQLLGSKLPPFMVPHHVLFLDSLPINANGKLDRSALPDPFRPIEDVTAGASGGAATVAGWWERILGRRVPSIDTSFFDAGGTSLEAVRLLELIERELGREIEPTFVFRYATIRRQADAITTLASDDAPAGGRGQLRRAALAQRHRGRAA